VPQLSKALTFPKTGQTVTLVEIMGNKGKKRDVHITRKAPIFLNLAQRKHHVKAPSYADVNIQVEKAT
jgi:hypothetical protein